MKTLPSESDKYTSLLSAYPVIPVLIYIYGNGIHACICKTFKKFTGNDARASDYLTITQDARVILQADREMKHSRTPKHQHVILVTF